MTVIALSLVLVLCIGASLVSSCTDFYMNFTSFSLSGRSMDLGGLQNWTITSWPRKLDGYGSESSYYWWPAKYGTVGISANWLGDDNYALPMLFGDSLNEKGLSCSSLALEGTQYQQKSLRKQNLFFGVFCLYVTQTYDNVLDLMDALREIAVWGIDDVAQHYVIRDSTGDSLVVEFVGGEQKVYLDRNDGVDGFGIMTNEPTYDWHVSNVLHYEWKRSLTRQAVVIPGNFYPEERYLRTHMIKR